jgi:hypothetical protein
MHLIVRKRNFVRVGPSEVGPRKDKAMITSGNSPQATNATRSSFGVIRQIPCDGPECKSPAILRLDHHIFCLDHLVLHCLDRLEACQREICHHAIPSGDSIASNNCFLEECTSRIAGFLMARSDLANIERARLLDVLLWAAEIDAKYIGSQPVCRAIAKSAGSR